LNRKGRTLKKKKKAKTKSMKILASEGSNHQSRQKGRERVTSRKKRGQQKKKNKTNSAKSRGEGGGENVKIVLAVSRTQRTTSKLKEEERILGRKDFGRRGYNHMEGHDFPNFSRVTVSLHIKKGSRR